jgi:LDH2 family malate/lactate/ureidoglycolate dehydrogenase
MADENKEIIYLDGEILQDLMQKILISKSVDKEAATRVSEGLVQTSLRGIDSHGINLFPHYCRAVKAGRINKKPEISIKQNASSVAIVDADHAFGHHSGSVAVQHAIKMAKENGIGAVGVKNSSHFGSAAYFAFQANKENCIGMAFTNGDALVKIYNSKEIFFGTNPICFTAPLKNEEPFCIDMATSQVAWNKVQNYKRQGMKLEEGWAYDIDGKETLDAEKANSLVSIGKYKGYGLGMMVDILCATLVGGVISKDMLSMHKAPINEKRMVSHFFMVIDISKFINIDAFKDSLQEMVDRIRKYEKSDTEDVMVAGDPEKKSFKKRSEEGIPVDEDKFNELISISAEIKSAVKKK